jgi:hypothetical protein
MYTNVTLGEAGDPAQDVAVDRVVNRDFDDAAHRHAPTNARRR